MFQNNPWPYFWQSVFAPRVALTRLASADHVYGRCWQLVFLSAFLYAILNVIEEWVLISSNLHGGLIIEFGHPVNLPSALFIVFVLSIIFVPLCYIFVNFIWLRIFRYKTQPNGVYAANALICIFNVPFTMVSISYFSLHHFLQWGDMLESIVEVVFLILSWVYSSIYFWHSLNITFIRSLMLSLVAILALVTILIVIVLVTF